MWGQKGRGVGGTPTHEDVGLRAKWPVAARCDPGVLTEHVVLKDSVDLRP